MFNLPGPDAGPQTGPQGCLKDGGSGSDPEPQLLSLFEQVWRVGSVPQSPSRDMGFNSHLDPEEVLLALLDPGSDPPRAGQTVRSADFCAFTFLQLNELSRVWTGLSNMRLWGHMRVFGSSAAAACSFYHKGANEHEICAEQV